MDWTSLPRSLCGLIFGALSPYDVCDARLVCRAFAQVLPVWHAVALEKHNPTLRCQLSQVCRLSGWLGSKFHKRPMLLHDRPWSFQSFPSLRFCRLQIDTQELLPLAAAVAGLPSLDLHLRILDGDGEAEDVVRGLAALADHVIGLDLDNCIVFIESVVGCLPLLRRLDAVDISRQGGTEWALGHLRQQEPRLQRLDCFYNELDDVCLPLLASFTNLTWLDVSNHIRHVRFVAGMPRLRILDLKATDVYDLQPLAALPCPLPCLEELNLADRRAPNGSELESLFGLQTLKLVDLSANVRIQPASVAGLRTALPRCKVLYDPRRPKFEP